MRDLTGKAALITGSAGGIGLGIARACVDRGMKVALADIDEAALADSAQLLRARGAEVIALTLDVRDRDSWARAAREVPAAIGPVQLLVNNAGVSASGLSFDEVSPDFWDRVIGINLTGVYNGVLHFLDGMRVAGGGHIVNTASMGGLIGGPRLAPYVAAKFGVVGLSEALRLELADDRVGVSVLCPGYVRSRLWRTSRPLRGLPDTDSPPEDVSGESARATMLPDEVGQRVLEGVVANDLYILTHPEYREPIVERHLQILRSFERAEQFTRNANV